MKRRLDKNKVYALIGRAVVYSAIYFTTIAGTVWAFCQNTIYQEEERMEEKKLKKPLILMMVVINIVFFSTFFISWIYMFCFIINITK